MMHRQEKSNPQAITSFSKSEEVRQSKMTSHQYMQYRHNNNGLISNCKKHRWHLDFSKENIYADKKELDDFPDLDTLLIRGRYLIIKQIEQDQLATVYQVRDIKNDNSNLFFRILDPTLTDDDNARNRFEEEATYCIDLNSAPKIEYDHLESGHTILWYITGCSLAYHMGSRGEKQPPFTLEEIWAVMHPLLEILEFAHSFTIHNHISPTSIVLIGSLPDVYVRLLGFGADDDLLTSLTVTNQENHIAYMAPELLNNRLGSDLHSDLYSVGIILYEMLTGQQAIGAFPRASEVLSNIYYPIDKVIFKVLSSDPCQRHKNARHLLKEIASAFDEIAETMEEQLIPKTIKLEQNDSSLFSTEQLTGKSRNFLLVLFASLIGLTAGSYFAFNYILKNPSTSSYNDDKRILFVPKPTIPSLPNKIIIEPLGSPTTAYVSLKTLMTIADGRNYHQLKDGGLNYPGGQNHRLKDKTSKDVD